MLNPTSLLADALGRNLAETYRRIYGDQEPLIPAGLDEAARLVIERIASSDALYHDCEHTALVTLCVQDILRGRRLERMVTPSDWGHTIWAALNHDIGYVRGICHGDTAEHFVIDAAGNTVTPPRGASDAFLMPYHVERGKIFVRERSRRVFEQQRIEGFGFDPEILFLAKRHGLRTAEIPVRWAHDAATKVHVVRDSLLMFGDLVYIRWNWLVGRYPKGVRINSPDAPTDH